MLWQPAWLLRGLLLRRLILLEILLIRDVWNGEDVLRKSIEELCVLPHCMVCFGVEFKLSRLSEEVILSVDCAGRQDV